MQRAIPSVFLMALLLLSSCAREVWRTPMALDTAAAVLPALPAGGKYKFTGPVTFTIATAPGAVATSTTTDNRKAGQRGGAAATAPGSSASTTKQNAIPWWVYGLFVVGGLVLGFWLRSKLPNLGSLFGKG